MALPIGTEFISGMKLKVRYEDATKLQHERTIGLYQVVQISNEGRTKWIDTSGSYWTEDFLLKNATLVEEVSRLEETCNEKRSAEVSKNFDEIKVGSWYIKRNGGVIKLGENHLYHTKGNWLLDEESSQDLVLEI